MTTTRRALIAAMSAIAALPAGRLAAATAPGQPFSWDWLKAEAARLAARPFTARPDAPAAIAAVDYDALNAISYKAGATQLAGAGFGGVRFFPINKMQPKPVAIFLVENNIAHPFDYRPALFDMPASSPLAKLGDRAGFSGFRAMNPNGQSDWLAFAGASYFRSAGALDQYGLSARGIAIGTGGPEAEEFPDFTRFWIGRGEDGALLVDALLEGPSVTGAYRFVNRHGAGGVVQEVEAALFVRKDIKRLGLAPLTSMFWYDQSERAKASDWRPEIHDSDGLLMWNGAGEQIFRALNNPPHPITNSFADKGPKGFGLVQRDRQFDHYQDDGVFYEKRPTAWVEPVGDWGAGAVTLVELPTDSETNDNIVAFWTPAEAARAGKRYDLRYRLRWIAGEPIPGGLARVVDSWRGAGGRPGHAQIKGVTKLVVDFAGASLAGLGRDSGVAPDLQIGHASAAGAVAYPVVGTRDRWRFMADITPAGGSDPIDVRVVLRRQGKPLTEVCLIQMIPG
ncbi:glucan biosynthesis protein [Sphingomonas morindae]|uniref:Glucan biosynthesis protein n=1 Tax=Sphingomonas morindae TaxID=1541170 RepID=A0ABY4X505_9SPHN|nr:glucan biosynthesis protein [Sphingomonas morindae]USI71965.1 glucan biosynthesis protein [Sphingomonas morindae]